MLQVLACITQHHDLRLVAVAGFICLLASYTAMSMAGRAAEATGRSRTGWSLVAGIVSGSGIWATHFIGMLAFQPDMPVTYGIQRTVLSILIAIGMSGLGLAIALIQRLEARVIGGITIGLGIGIMHYLGMSALRIQAELQYDPSLMLASLVLGPVIAAMAIELGLSRPDRKHRVIGAVLLTVAICSLHFTGMAAAHILPNPTIVVPGHSIEPRSLAVAITAVAFMVTVLGLYGSAVDQYLADRSHEEAKRLRASETRFRQLANATFEGIVIHIGGEIVDANAILCSLIQRPHEWLVGRHILDIFEPNDDLRVREQIMSGPDRSMAVELRCVHRAPIPAEIFGQTIEYGQAKARVITVRDLSERRVVEAQIRHMVDHDALTGLPTRNLFYERLDRLVSRASASGKPVAVLCMDLDRFKEVNDLVGHVGGDAILRQCSERLTALIGAPETIARISGDEFAVVQIGDFDLEQTARLAGRLVAMIGEPFMLDTQQVIVGASVGIAVFPSDGASAEDLVRAASTAMRQAKEAGRNTYRFFEADMNGRLQNRRQLQRDLSQALALNQFEMHYQPLVDCRTGAAIGFEALIRWHHPDRGLVSPAEFIPLAEESGMIVPLGNWILETVCAEAAK